jgi:hypothetical protein
MTNSTSQKKELNKKSFYLFPYIFGIYPVLALIAHNMAEMNLGGGLRALIVSILVTLLLNLTLMLLLKNPIKSALLTSFILLLIYSYGHINILARGWSILNLSLGRHRTLLPVYALIAILITWLILKTKRDLSGSTRFLNAFALILLIFPLYQIISYQIENSQAQQKQEEAIIDTQLVSLSENQIPPDVYFIVTDGYPRSDFISQFLHSSNEDFLNSLEARGFYVARCSMSNYTDTRFSLASILNMTYLDDGQNIPEVVLQGSTLDSMIRTGNVQKNFSDLHYTIVTFESGFKWLHWKESNLHLVNTQESSSQFFKVGLNEFEQLFLETTAAKLIFDIPILINQRQSGPLEEIVKNPRESHRKRVMFTLDQLPTIPESIPSPKFVYAHIIFPHPPFVVDAEGNPIQNSPPDELKAYADQIAYLDQRLLEIIDKLIERSDPKPIIIIQGDHGATIDYKNLGIDKSYRLGILNAYYLPENPNSTANSTSSFPERLYPSITPVNSFRLIFDKYFNGNYGLIEDKSIVGRQSPYTTLECTPSE